MSVTESLASIEDSHAATLGAFSDLASLQALVQGEGDDEGGDRDLGQIVEDWSPLLIRIGIYAGAEMLLNGLEEHINDLKREYRAQLREFHTRVGQVADAADDGELVMLVGGALPGIGPTISRLQLNRLLGRIEVSGEDLERNGVSMDQSLSRHIAFLERLHTGLENLVRVVEVVDAVLTFYGFLPDSLEPALGDFDGLPSGGPVATPVDPDDPVALLSEEADGPAGSFDTPLIADARVTAGAAAYAMRFEAETSDYVHVIDAMGQIMAPVQAAIDGVVTPAAEGLDEALGFIAELAEPLDVLDGLEALAAPFVSALTTMASPINAFFDFLEDPPRVFGIRVFPAIPRTAIQTILDFLDDLNGVVQEAVEFFLGDLLAPIQNAANALLNKLIPIDQFIAPVNEAIASLTALADVMAGLTPDIPDLGVDDLLAELRAAVAPTVEAFAVEEGDAARNVFFGAAGDETVTGLTRAEAAAADLPEGEVAPLDEMEGDPEAADPIPGAVLSGAGGNDDLTGTELADFLLGGAGDDTLTGLGGDDALLAGAGDDVLDGGAGDDAIDGGEGRDRAVFAGASTDYEIGFEDGLLVVDGPDGRDTLAGIETLVFDDGEILAGLFAPDEGGDGDDVIVRGGDDDDLSGGAGDDAINAGGGADRLAGGSGDDALRGGAGRDRLLGGADDDYLNGGRGNDVLKGQGGDDFLFGGPGRDKLVGGAGNDTLSGGPGADRLIGGKGDDLLIGGKHADLMVFRAADGTDVIEGFGLGNDHVRIRGLDDFDALDIVQDGADAVATWRSLTLVFRDQDADALDADHFLL